MAITEVIKYFFGSIQVEVIGEKICLEHTTQFSEGVVCLTKSEQNDLIEVMRQLREKEATK